MLNIALVKENLDGLNLTGLRGALLHASDAELVQSYSDLDGKTVYQYMFESAAEFMAEPEKNRLAYNILEHLVNVGAGHLPTLRAQVIPCLTGGVITDPEYRVVLAAIPQLLVPEKNNAVEIAEIRQCLEGFYIWLTKTRPSADEAQFKLICECLKVVNRYLVLDADEETLGAIKSYVVEGNGRFGLNTFADDVVTLCDLDDDAYRAGLPAMAERIKGIKDHGELIQCVAWARVTPASYAAAVGRPEIAEMILAQEIEVNSSASVTPVLHSIPLEWRRGSSPLYFFMESSLLSGFKRIVKQELLMYFAVPNISGMRRTVRETVELMYMAIQLNVSLPESWVFPSAADILSLADPKFACVIDLMPKEAAREAFDDSLEALSGQLLASTTVNDFDLFKASFLKVGRHELYKGALKTISTAEFVGRLCQSVRDRSPNPWVCFYILQELASQSINFGEQRAEVNELLRNPLNNILSLASQGRDTMTLPASVEVTDATLPDLLMGVAILPESGHSPWYLLYSHLKNTPVGEVDLSVILMDTIEASLSDSEFLTEDALASTSDLALIELFVLLASLDSLSVEVDRPCIKAGLDIVRNAMTARASKNPSFDPLAVILKVGSASLRTEFLMLGPLSFLNQDYLDTNREESVERHLSTHFFLYVSEYVRAGNSMEAVEHLWQFLNGFTHKPALIARLNTPGIRTATKSMLPFQYALQFLNEVAEDSAKLQGYMSIIMVLLEYGARPSKGDDAKQLMQLFLLMLGPDMFIPFGRTHSPVFLMYRWAVTNLAVRISSEDMVAALRGALTLRPLSDWLSEDTAHLAVLQFQEFLLQVSPSDFSDELAVLSGHAMEDRLKVILDNRLSYSLKAWLDAGLEFTSLADLYRATDILLFSEIELEHAKPLLDILFDESQRPAAQAGEKSIEVILVEFQALITQFEYLNKRSERQEATLALLKFYPLLNLSVSERVDVSVVTHGVDDCLVKFIKGGQVNELRYLLQAHTKDAWKYAPIVEEGLIKGCVEFPILQYAMLYLDRFNPLDPRKLSLVLENSHYLDVIDELIARGARPKTLEQTKDLIQRYLLFRRPSESFSILLAFFIEEGMELPVEGDLNYELAYEYINDVVQTSIYMPLSLEGKRYYRLPPQVRILREIVSTVKVFFPPVGAQEVVVEAFLDLTYVGESRNLTEALNRLDFESVGPFITMAGIRATNFKVMDLLLFLLNDGFSKEEKLEIRTLLLDQLRRSPEQAKEERLGVKPLHLAVHLGDLECVEKILEQRIRYEITSGEHVHPFAKYSPFDLAIAAGHFDIADKIQEKIHPGAGAAQVAPQVSVVCFEYLNAELRKHSPLYMAYVRYSFCSQDGAKVALKEFLSNPDLDEDTLSLSEKAELRYLALQLEVDWPWSLNREENLAGIIFSGETTIFEDLKDSVEPGDWADAYRRLNLNDLAEVALFESHNRCMACLFEVVAYFEGDAAPGRLKAVYSGVSNGQAINYVLDQYEVLDPDIQSETGKLLGPQYAIMLFERISLLVDQGVTPTKAQVKAIKKLIVQHDHMASTKRQRESIESLVNHLKARFGSVNSQIDLCLESQSTHYLGVLLNEVEPGTIPEKQLLKINRTLDPAHPLRAKNNEEFGRRVDQLTMRELGEVRRSRAGGKGKGGGKGKARGKTKGGRPASNSAGSAGASATDGLGAGASADGGGTKNKKKKSLLAKHRDDIFPVLIRIIEGNLNGKSHFTSFTDACGFVNNKSIVRALRNLKLNGLDWNNARVTTELEEMKALTVKFALIKKAFKAALVGEKIDPADKATALIDFYRDKFANVLVLLESRGVTGIELGDTVDIQMEVVAAVIKAAKKAKKDAEKRRARELRFGLEYDEAAAVFTQLGGFSISVAEPAPVSAPPTTTASLMAATTTAPAATTSAPVSAPPVNTTTTASIMTATSSAPAVTTTTVVTTTQAPVSVSPATTTAPATTTLAVTPPAGSPPAAAPSSPGEGAAASVPVSMAMWSAPPSVARPDLLGAKVPFIEHDRDKEVVMLCYSGQDSSSGCFFLWPYDYYVVRGEGLYYSGNYQAPIPINVYPGTSCYQDDFLVARFPRVPGNSVSKIWVHRLGYPSVGCAVMPVEPIFLKSGECFSVVPASAPAPTRGYY